MAFTDTNTMFGWKTSFQHWNDDAVYIIDVEILKIESERGRIGLGWVKSG